MNERSVLGSAAIYCLCVIFFKSEFYEEDISKGNEPMPVSLVNAYENTPPRDLVYVAKRFFSRELESSNRICFATRTRPDGSRVPQTNKDGNLFLDTDFLLGCDCTDDCCDKSRCACQQLSIAESDAAQPGATRNPNVGYSFKRLNDFSPTGIYECNALCRCGPACRNRVVQHGVKVRLQLFLTDGKGWGVRCLDDIPKGTFVCAYNGEILSPRGAVKKGMLFFVTFFLLH